MFKYSTLALLFVGLLFSSTASTETVASRGSEIEVLLGVRVASSGLSFQVFSGGCTRKSDFEVQVFESETLQLLLVRHHPDLCEAFVPFGKRVRFSFEELGLENGDQVRVLNPLSSFRIVTRQ